MEKGKEFVTIPYERYLSMLRNLVIWKLKVFFNDVDDDEDFQNYLNDLYQRNPNLFEFDLNSEIWEFWELWEDKALQFFEDQLFDDDPSDADLSAQFHKVIDYYFKRKKDEKEQREQDIEQLEKQYQMVA